MYIHFLSRRLRPLSRQVYQHEVQSCHVHQLIFPQLLLRGRLLRGLLFQQLHLRRLLLLQHG